MRADSVIKCHPVINHTLYFKTIGHFSQVNGEPDNERQVLERSDRRAKQQALPSS